MADFLTVILQFRLLLWKNFLLRRRRPVLLIIEILSPLLLIGTLAKLASNSKRVTSPSCFYSARPMPSAGTIPWLKKLFCNYNDLCNPYPNKKGKHKDNSHRKKYNDQLSKEDNVFQDLMFFLQDRLPSSTKEDKKEHVKISLSRFVCGYQSDLFYDVSSFESNPEIFRYYENKSNDESNSKSDKIYDSKFKYCMDMFKSTMFQTNFFFHIPMLTGKIYYTPNTELTRSFVRNSNGTFEGLALLTNAIKQWNREVSEDVKGKLFNGSKWNSLRGDCLNEKQKNTAFCFFLKNHPMKKDKFNYHYVFEQLNPIMKELEKIVECFNWDKFVPMNSESEMLEEMNKKDNYWAGVVFDGISNKKKATVNEVTHVSIRVRMIGDDIDSTVNWKVLYDLDETDDSEKLPLSKYIKSGFIYLQEIMGNGVSQTITGKASKQTVHLQKFPKECGITDPLQNLISGILPIFLILGWLVSVSMTVRAIVYEKEHRIKEVMKIMGLSNGVHWLGWFFTTILIMFPSIILLTIILSFSNLLQFSSSFVLFFFIWSFIVATLMQTFLFSVFFNNANVAAGSAGIIFFGLYLPAFLVKKYITNESLNQSGYFGWCLISQIAFSTGCEYISIFEKRSIGIQLSNIWSAPNKGGPFNFGYCIIMLWVDTLLYFLFTWYIEAVFPGKFGVPCVWYFPFTREYWCGRTQIPPKKSFQEDPHEPNPPLQEANTSNCNTNYFEKELRDIPVGVSVQNLYKIFKKGSKPAVNGLNIDFYENQITSFLGHNGAGKTTTISILTGLYTPTSGTAYIYGRNISTDMDAIRNNLGLCPQYNVLFDYLTVEEHIYFYGLLKGMPENEIFVEIDKFVDEVGLPQKRKELSMKLSGGMKRKLSVAMAFVGGSKVVILDEPTAGVDPYARRSIWDLLVSCRKDRTIILTTHHMDEADILGDRVAIISQGSLKCCGSSLFLKNAIGSGYNLILVKANVYMEEKESANIKIANNTNFIKKYVRGSQLTEDTTTEWIYQLPRSGHDNGEFKQLFEALDNNLVDLGISSYGIADTSLEEVFLTMAHDPSDEFKEQSIERLTDGGNYPPPVSRNSFRESRNKISCFPWKKMAASIISNEKMAKEDSINRSTGSYSITGCELLGMHVLAIWIKRLHNMKRNIRGFIAEIFVPIIFMLIIVMITKKKTAETHKNPPMTIHPWLLLPKQGNTHLSVFYSIPDAPNSNVRDKLTQMIHTPLGLGGVRCMNASVHSIIGYPCIEPDVSNSWSKKTCDGVHTQISSTCQCNKFSNMDCPSNGTCSPEPSSKLMRTSDYLYNLTGFNELYWILSTKQKFKKRRFGGFAYNFNDIENYEKRFKHIENNLKGSNSKNVKEFWKNLGIFLKTALPVSPDDIKVFHNPMGLISAPAYLSVLQNNLMRLNVPDDKAGNIGYSFSSHPLGESFENVFDQIYEDVLVNILISVCIIFALAFIPASFLLFLIEERVSNSKHLQFVSGVNPTMYWISNYMWDILNYIIPCSICILVFVIFDKQSYISSEKVGSFVLLLFFYGIAIIPLMYLASFIFSTSSTAFVVVSTINLLLGLLTTVPVFILSFLEKMDKDKKKSNDILKTVFLVLPQYCLGHGLFMISEIDKVSFDSEKKSKSSDFLAWGKIGNLIFILFVQSIFFFMGVIFIEHNFWCKQRQGRMNTKFEINPVDMDDDVRIEKDRVLNGDADKDAVRLVKLSKVYPGKNDVRPAVNNLCLGIRSGECFGFLGVNGAGKTTTFKMLTGHESITSGDAIVSGFSVISDMIEVHKRVGYCPQFDALNNLLTARETLWLYSRLRGIPKKEIADVVEWALRRLSLQPHADKTSGTYSGGNKRKLSTAVALIGNPNVIFLDEPTSGMDAGARRFLWNCILDIVKEGRSVVLTTHSMEECEALSQRLCIMVNGSLQCLGSVQHLKTKFGKGYTLSMTLNNSNPRFAELFEYIKSHLLNAVLMQKNHTLLEYQIPSEIKLSEIFSVLQKAKVDLKIVDEYSVSQTTLDQVFINFAKSQNEDKYSEVDEKLEAPQTTETMENTGSTSP